MISSDGAVWKPITDVAKATTAEVARGMWDTIEPLRGGTQQGPTMKRDGPNPARFEPVEPEEISRARRTGQVIGKTMVRTAAVTIAVGGIVYDSERFMFQGRRWPLGIAVNASVGIALYKTGIAIHDVIATVPAPQTVDSLPLAEPASIVQTAPEQLL